MCDEVNFFGINQEEQPHNNIDIDEEEFNEQQTLSLSSINENVNIVSIQEYIKCEHCFKELKIDQYENHQANCRKQSIKIMKQMQKRTRVSFHQNYQIIPPQYRSLPEKRSCLYCKQYNFISTISQHQDYCKVKQYYNRIDNFRQNIDSSQYFGGRCIWCTNKISETEQKDHEQFCKTKDKTHRQLISFQPSTTQFKAMCRFYEQSAFENLYYQETLIDFMKKYGYTKQDLVTMSSFIKNQAPIYIHFDLSKCIKQFLNDSEYRNVFETYKSSDLDYTKRRKIWETYLFGHYYDQCQPNQRVKYGFLNYSNDRYGSRKCQTYGTSILVLNQNVRKRCTISHNRQYSANEIVATLKYSHAVLLRFSQKQLKALYLASRGFEIDSSQLENFKEVHIHGSIKFFRDVKCIYTSKQERKENIYNVKLFEKKFGVKILTYEQIGAEQLI